MMENMVNRDDTTPPLTASSSPVLLDVNDNMVTSSLPHKEPYSIEITSPTPGEFPKDGGNKVMLGLSVPIARDRLHPFKSRKRLALGPSPMTRKKRHPTNAWADRLRTDTRLAAFYFNPEAKLPLGEYFQQLPPQKRPSSARIPSSGGPGSYPLNPRFADLKGATELRNGSSSPHSRESSNTFRRPQHEFCRSLSPENPVDMVKPKTNNLVPQIAHQLGTDIEDVRDHMLPHFYPEGKNETIPRISQRTFLDVLDGKHEDQYTRRMVIDCRFEYEYKGGHIDGAISCTDRELLTRHLFKSPREGKVLLVLHCEYSVHRAPMMARHIRSEDRAIHAEVYPRLSYPDLYILAGGYNEFFAQHRCRCYPQSYVKMNDEEHIATCEREMGKLRQKQKITYERHLIPVK